MIKQLTIGKAARVPVALSISVTMRTDASAAVRIVACLGGWSLMSIMVGHFSIDNTRLILY